MNSSRFYSAKKVQKTFYIIFILFVLISNQAIYSQIYNDKQEKLKKVAILPFQNIEKKSEAEYLEASITDAVREYLKAALAFNETLSVDILRYAKSNYYFQDELHTATSQMHLGLDMKQDIIIGGKYRIEGRKTGDQEVTYLITVVRILDIGQKKVLKEFTIEGPADNRIFESIQEVSKRIAKEASAVLPTKEEWEAEKFVIKNTYNSFALGGGISYFSSPQFIFPVHLSYMRQGFFWYRLALLVDVEGSIGSQNYTLELVQMDIKTKGISGIMALGIHLLDFGRIEVKSFIGGGLYYQWYDLKYTYLNSGSLPSNASIGVYAPVIYAGVIARIPLFGNFNLDVHPYYKLLIFPGAILNSMPGLQVGMSFNFH